MSARPARSAALWAVLALALILRLGRGILRWDEIALAYAAYQQPWVDAAAAGDPVGIFTTFTGLHPPLYSALFGLVGWVWGAPAGWLLLSVGASLAAVALVGRSYGAVAALVLAVDPLQLAYCAEVNNYPLLVAMVAGCLAARRHLAEGGSWVPLAVVGILAGWTHLLGGAFAGMCALSLGLARPRATLSVLGAMAVGTAPVVWRALGLAGDEGTYGQPGLELGVVLAGLVDKVGEGWLLVWALALFGSLWRRAEGALYLGALGLIGLSLALGVAAPHQQPYWLLLGPLQAALVGAYPRVVGALAALLGLSLVHEDLDRLRALRADQSRPRAIDAALAASQPGDALWLLAPGLEPDDDKRAFSTVLWRFNPLESAPPWRGDGGLSFEYTDYWYGQPRWLGGRIVHTSTFLEQSQFQQIIDAHLAAGRRVQLVLYDHGPADDYPGLVERSLQPYRHRCARVGEDVGLGTDLLCVVEARE